jgi:Concanavalin A-like lectin/glucanases superfamily
MQVQETVRDNLNSQAISENVSNAAESVKEGAANAYNSLANTATSIKENVTNSLDQFSSKAAVDPTADQGFLNSNSIIAKFVFLVLVLIAFLFLVRLGIIAIAYFLQPPPAPYVILGTNPGNNAVTVNQDPSDPNSPIIQRSNNQKTGLEFTWSVWLLYQGYNPSSSAYSHIFNKGTNDYDTNAGGIAITNNGPGLYFKAGPTPGLHIIMDDVTNIPNTMDISGIPVGKWFHVAVRMENKVMDVYINGMISGRYVFQNVPKQNYQSIYVSQNGGFNGTLSNLRYFNYALDVTQINNILLAGPNLTASTLSQKAASTNYSYYLSSLWYNNKLTV